MDAMDTQPSGQVLRILAVVGPDGFGSQPPGSTIFLYVLDTTDGEISRIPDSAGGLAMIEQRKPTLLEFEAVPFAWSEM